MKKFLCTDISKKSNTQVGDEFLAQKTPSRIIEKLDRAEDVVTEIKNKYRLPMIFIPIEMVFSIIALLVAYVIVSYVIDGKFDVLKSTSGIMPWLYGVGAFSAFAVITIRIVTRKKERAIKNLEEYKFAKNKSDLVASEAEAILGATTGCVELDVFGFDYKGENPQNHLKIQGNTLNYGFKAFVEDGKLCLVEASLGRYEIPISSSINAFKVDEKVSFFPWNKKENIKSEKYKIYNISGSSVYKITGYIAVELGKSDNATVFFVPLYEEENLKILLGKDIL